MDFVTSLGNSSKQIQHRWLNSNVSVGCSEVCSEVVVIGGTKLNDGRGENENEKKDLKFLKK